MQDATYIRWFSSLGRDDVATVGGKNASLGEMYQHLKPLGVEVPNGFALTAGGTRIVMWQAHYVSKTIVFQLIVNDGTQPSSAVQTTVTINPPTNQPPVASAGANQSVAQGATVTLNGSGRGVMSRTVPLRCL